MNCNNQRWCQVPSEVYHQPANIDECTSEQRNAKAIKIAYNCISDNSEGLQIIFILPKYRNLNRPPVGLYILSLYFFFFNHYNNPSPARAAATWQNYRVAQKK